MVTEPTPPDHGPADVAVCTLTSVALAARLESASRVAIAASMATANLGIEQLVIGALSTPYLRHLVVCGSDSPLFRQGQSLLALAANGCDRDGTIIGAVGYRARVAGLRPTVVGEFRRRITVHDLIGTDDPATLVGRIGRLPRLRAIALPDGLEAELAASGSRLRQVTGMRPRVPIAAAGEGFFVIDVDHSTRRIRVRHYRDDLASGHEMTGRSAEALLLRILGLGLVRENTHAGYLGAELTKAETAARLGLSYHQDRPLRPATGREPDRLSSTVSPQTPARHTDTNLSEHLRAHRRP
ncbi:hypothetical protein ACI2K4_03495 [Micromonospora sp. NPDC050397]|uniref:DUF4346 domain-containing protein n=1 Tax=Micromonospora sp. NPDC050397 TaxID=3364279 RepID=UPI00384E8F89